MLKYDPRTNSNAKVIYTECGATCQNTDGSLNMPAYHTYVREKSDEKFELYDNRNLLATQLAIGTASIYLINLIDSYFAGQDNQKKFKLYFSVLPSAKGASIQLTKSF